MKATSLGMVSSLLFSSFCPSSETGTPPAAALPRYKFDVGQELVYSGSSLFKYENGAHETKDQTTLWITRRNDDGSWHVVARSENTFAQHFGTSAKNTPRIDKSQALGEFDVQADGTILNPPPGYQGRSLTSMIFKLPASSREIQSGWTVETDGGTERSLYKVAGNSDRKTGRWVFERSEAGLFSVIYVSTSKALIHFDANLGLVTKIETENSQGYGFNGKGTGSVELKSTARRDLKWIEQLAREAASFSKVQGALMEADNSAGGDADPESRYARAEEALRDSRGKAHLPLIVAQFEEQQKRVAESKKYRAEDKEKEDSVLGKEAADWSTTDIDGGKHSMAGYKGKVVVLDFWYRGCGWCIKAMPQIKEVVDHFRDEPVAVLGMNTDREEKDARFVVEKLGLNYATLKAQGLPEKYGVQGFPTFIVVDQKGIVRKRHVGYSKTLLEELVAEIDRLLKETK